MDISFRDFSSEDIGQLLRPNFSRLYLAYQLYYSLIGNVTEFQETSGRIRASINRGSATWTPLWNVADAHYVKRIKSKTILGVDRVLIFFFRLVTWLSWRGQKWTEVLTWVNKCTLSLNDYETRRPGRIRPLRKINAWISNIFALFFSLDFTHVYHETLSGQNSPKTPKTPPDIVYIAFDKKKSPQKTL